MAKTIPPRSSGSSSKVHAVKLSCWMLGATDFVTVADFVGLNDAGFPLTFIPFLGRE